MDAFATMTDDDVLLAMRGGDGNAQDFLLDKYKPLVRLKSRAYFLAGADRDDIIQEGMIGLYKAMKDYDPKRGAGFRTFAALCVTRQIQTAVKLASRRKHQPLNTYVSLDVSAAHGDGDGAIAARIHAPTTDNPEETFLSREAKESMETRIGASLSPFECRVLASYLRGQSYAGIAAAEGCTGKAVDNALQRVRRKIERGMEKQS